MISKEVRGNDLGQIVKDALVLCLTPPILGLDLQSLQLWTSILI
jgi:hypothetical protein